MSINRLMALGAVGLVSCVGMGIVFRNAVSDKIKNSTVCKEALEEVRNNKGAILLLGEPIEPLKATFASSGWFSDNQLDIKVNVTGSKSKGIIFFSVSHDDLKKIQLESVQLQIGMDDNKRLVIKS